MKKIWLLTLVVSLSGFAAYQPGSKCGLTDTTSDKWKETASLNLSKHSKVSLDRLSTLTKQQLIIAAKAYASGEEQEINNTQAAVDFFREGSEGGDLYVVDFEYKNREFTQVLFYPGGNPVGFIFKADTRRIVAENSDDSISCR